ncbi:MAG: aspartate aminotransferase family protein [Acidobacteriota bacterium]|nr:aspartate aminotransferase family protein [Acidobacteriota bacterium]MDQ7088388.1 aspartate aminotransferase family protein [Acidobacteriota bacterium]
MPRALATLTDRLAAHAEGAWVTDTAGRTYLDFATGIGTLATGHRHPKVLAAVRRQLDRLVHTCYSVMPYESYQELVGRLIDLTPGSFPKRGLLLNSGAEAVENALKIARAATGRPAVLCFEGAFHGRTLLALGLTSKTSTYKRGFGPYPGEIYRVPYPYCYRCPVGREPATCSVDCRRLLEEALATHVDGRALAAVLIEPQLGEGGGAVAPFPFLQAIRELCDRTGAVMVVDEVQTGFGRTGSLFAVEQAGVEPDLMVMAKSLASGFPISAVVGRAELFDGIQVGGLGGTYGGNPVSCAAALATLEVIVGQRLPERARRLGAVMRRRMQLWQERYPEYLGDLRGLGAMLALEVVSDRQTRRPLPALARAWSQACLDEGLLLLTAGVHGNVVRVLIPLIISDADLNEGLERMERALETAVASLARVEETT